MISARRIWSFLVALTGLAWLTPSYADLPCFQPGPMAPTYAAEALSHPWDDAFGTSKRVHSYQFTVPQAKKLCSIGYEAPVTAPASYQFKLYNCNSGTPVPIPGASVTVPGSTFPNGSTTYYTLPGSWVLLPGNCYEIRRRVVGPATPAQRTGRRLDNETSYPIVGSAITILSTDFFSGAPPQIVDMALPYIDFGTR